VADYSPGLTLAWQLAGAEAVASQHEFIERDHAMIGVLKLVDAVTDDELIKKLQEQGLDPAVLRAEAGALAKCLDECTVNAAKARRRLRFLLGRGTCTVRDSDAIRRSEACREVFDRAAARVEGSDRAVTSLHLLASLLDPPTVRIAQAIAFGGGDVETLKRAALESLEAVVIAGAAKAPTKASGVLEQYGVDLTRQAEEGRIEPLIGRRDELLRVVRILCRKAKNNPVLIGDPGVGKTAIVRALAQRIAARQVPPELQSRRIIELNLAALVAGTKYRGEFEDRLTKIVKEATSRPDVILFIDEMHTIVHAGAAEGSLDAANILKPALAGSDLRCIGSTTIDEYRSSIEKDAALARRFQSVLIDEPSADEAIAIVEGLRERYAKHHGLRIEPDAARAAVELTIRYVPSRRLPDKAIDALDEACTRVKIGSISTAGDAAEALQAVTRETIAQVIGEWTGIPVERMTAGEQERLRHMSATLAERVIGQDEAIEKVTRIVTLSRAGLRDARRPVGVLLFAGPTGVGKTELCRALASFLFGSDSAMIRLDMSEYGEKHTVARLVGAPPGYIGHEEEGQLTGGLRRKPYSVVLLDEIEKAHPDVWNVFLQLFDDGRLTDSHGRVVDGRHAIFVMTSNLAISGPVVRSIGFMHDKTAEPVEAEDAGHADPRQRLRQWFRPEFINRIDDIVEFRALTREDVVRIAKPMLERVRQSLAAQDIEVEFEPEVAELAASLGFDPSGGARSLARVIDRAVSGPIGEKIVGGELGPGSRVRVGVKRGSLTFTVNGGAA